MGSSSRAFLSNSHSTPDSRTSSTLIRCIFNLGANLLIYIMKFNNTLCKLLTLDIPGHQIPFISTIHLLYTFLQIMLFMKGNRDEPRCGFSKTIIGLLSEYKPEYKTFDILSDNEVIGQ